MFCFHPREVKKYYAEVQFYVNSKLHTLKINGEGVLCFIELLDPHDKFVNLGCVAVGQTATKAIKVVNNSTAPVDIIFELHDRLPYFSRPKKVLQPEFDVEEEPLLNKKAKL